MNDSYEDMVRADNRIVLLLGAILAVFMLSMVFVSATSITDGLEAYYKLDETTGLVASDFSGNGNDGTMVGYTFNHGVINGGVTIEDGAMAFNGTGGYVKLGEGETFEDIKTAFTISAWIKPTSFNTSGNFPTQQVIFSKFRSITNERKLAFVLDNGNGTLSIYAKNEDDESWGGYPSSSTETVSLDEWSFVSASWDGTTLTFYINGVAKGSTAVSDSLLDGNTTHVFIGARSNTGTTPNSSFFEGSINDVQVYNRGLTSDEIEAQYNAGRGSYALSGNGLVAQYSGRDYNATHILDTNPVVRGNKADNVNTARNFDGTGNYVNLGNNSIFDFNNTPLSISGWFNTNNSSTLQTLIAKKSDLGDLSTGYSIFIEKNMLRTSISDGTNQKRNDTSAILQPNTWYNFVVIYNQSNIDIYLNNNFNVNSQIGTYPTGSIITGQKLNFGTDNKSRRFLYGSLQNVGIWNRALSEEEILYLYESSPHAQTSFTAEQVSGTTDTNITLSCTSINGCKTINYNVNNEGWNKIDDYGEGNDSNSATGQQTLASGTDWTTKWTFNIPSSWDAYTTSLGIDCYTIEGKLGQVRAKYTYKDETVSYSNSRNCNSATWIPIVFTIQSNSEKNMNKIEFQLNTQSSDKSITTRNPYVNYNYRFSIPVETYSFLYSGAGDHNIQFYSTDNANNNETTKLSYFPMFKSENEPSNSRIKLTGVTNYNGYTITSWLYQVNGTPLSGTTDRIKYYSTQSNQDLNVCLTTNNTDTICQNVFTWDTINPIIDANIKTSGYGFTNTFDINYNLTCNDNFPFITYKVIWANNGTTITLDEQYLATETLLQGTLDLNAGQEATLTFTCTDASNNQATYTAPTQYAIQFNIVDETTGLPFDLTKVTHAQAYTYDGNYLFNFKDTNNATQTYWSPTSVIRFDFTYPDEAQTKISREINFDYIDDANVPVCAAEYQQFYLYRFLSTTEKPIILYNDFANCYSLASTTKFLWTTYLTNTAYTINKPYYLYTYSNGVKSLLAILDGANNTEINLDILQFNQAQYQFDVASDSIVFRPGENDSNTIVFYFFSPNNNTWVNLEIYDQANNLLWDYLENTDTNSFQVTFFYGDLDINSDDLLKIVVTVLNDGDTTTFFKYFNTKGEAYAGLLNPIVAIVLSFFVLFFGITMVSYRFAMGWFGIVISFLAIGILALAPLYDYVLFLMAIYFIIGLFIGLIGREQTLGVN